MGLTTYKNRAAKALAAVGAAALSLALAGAASAQTMTVMVAMPSSGISSNLTVGSRGAEVVQLQGILSEAGYLSVGLPTGYFGSKTKAAVASFQKAVGVPSTGYFGPLSRAALESWMSAALSRMGASGSMTGTVASSNASAQPTGSVSTNGSSISTSLAPLGPTGYWYQGNWYGSVPAAGTANVAGYWVNGVWTAMPGVSTSVAQTTNTLNSMGTTPAATSTSAGYGISGSNWDPSQANTKSSVTCTLNAQNVYVCQ